MKKISFIIIGRNEGWKLELSLKSVFDSILLNNIVDVSEVIYVDSSSNDNSIEIANKFRLTHIIKITDSYYNAAVGRNLGASYSFGETLIFMDGDMQLEPSFVSKILDPNNSLLYDFVSGNILEYFYDENWKFLKKAFRSPNGNAYSKDRLEITVGGFFCVKRTLWIELNGMDSSLSICEDLDFGLRLSKKNIPLLRKKEIAIIHHTISPVYNNRLKKNLLSFNFKYYGLLYRKHLLNIIILKKIARSEFTLFFLLLLLLLSIYINSILPMTLYPLFILFRVWYHSRNKFFSLWDILNIILRDFTVFISFIFYFPINRKQHCQHILAKRE